MYSNHAYLVLVCFWKDGINLFNSHNQLGYDTFMVKLQIKKKEVNQMEEAAPGEEYLGPETIDVNNVQYWCRHTKELKKSQVRKAKLFVEYECVHYIGKGAFVCLPLNTESSWKVGGKVFKKIPYEQDYNNSEYIIVKKDGIFQCNCQGWQSKDKRGEMADDGCMCSHVLALMFCFKIKKDWGVVVEEE